MKHGFALVSELWQDAVTLDEVFDARHAFGLLSVFVGQALYRVFAFSFIARVGSFSGRSTR